VMFLIATATFVGFLFAHQKILSISQPACLHGPTSHGSSC
jgi:hypothetical protein